MSNIGQGSGSCVLAADDDADLRSLIGLVLTAEGYDVSLVENGRSALASAIRSRPDLVILDLMMPGMDGIEVCRALRSELSTRTVPIIMLTAKGSPGDAVAGLRAGADDYIMKPFDPEELVARVATALNRSADLRGTSPLTGLPGNFAILRRLEQVVASTIQDFAFVHADLDSFKAYNDHYGFLRGDEAIRVTAQVLHDVTDAQDLRFLGHIGGDDFALIVAADAAEETAQGIVAAFDDVAGRLYDPEDRRRGWIEVPDRAGVLHPSPLLTISLGVTTSESGPFSSAHQVAQAAAEVKALAKRDAGSSWRIDRRRRGST